MRCLLIRTMQSSKSDRVTQSPFLDLATAASYRQALQRGYIQIPRIGLDVFAVSIVIYVRDYRLYCFKLERTKELSYRVSGIYVHA